MSLRIKELCKAKGITLGELADKMSIKRESLSRAINGKPNLETLEKIAEALNVKVVNLFEDSSGTIGVIRHNDKSYEINSIHDIERVLEEIKKSDI